jgi:hypothetical protein
MPIVQTRRCFLTTLAAASAVSLAHASRVRAAEGALETTTVRIDKDRSTCAAPQDVAESSRVRTRSSLKAPTGAS